MHNKLSKTNLINHTFRESRVCLYFFNLKINNDDTRNHAKSELQAKRKTRCVQKQSSREKLNTIKSTMKSHYEYEERRST